MCKTASAGTNFCPAYNLDNQITSVSYDNDGDALSDPVSGAANAFDAEGRPTTFLGGAVIYDALGRAVEAGGHEFVYGPDGGKLAVMSGQTLVRADIPLPGGAEAVFNASVFAWYRHADWLGSSRLATTYAGAVYSSEAFAPFGEPLLETGTEDRGFTGMKQDIANGSTGDGNGQYDFLAREYSPTQSRWWTPDPAGLAAVDPANPQTWNRYAYVGGMPLANTDPTGLVCQQGQVSQDCEPGFSQGAGGYGGGGGYGGDSAGGGEFALASVPTCAVCSATLISPVNGLPYQYAVGPTGWTYTAPNGENFGEANLWEELDLPDFNLNYGGQPVAIAELNWRLSYGITDAPQTPPGSTTGVPSTSGPAPTPNQIQNPKPILVSYSRDYGAFLDCEWGNTVGDPDTLHTWAFVTGGALGVILTGGPWAKFSALFGYAAYDLGGAETIRAACSAATYGPAQ